MRCITPVLVAVVILLLPKSLRADTPNDWQIVSGDRVGKITSKSSESDLRKAYGNENVAEVEVSLGEGSTEKGTMLFPNDPRKRLQILWKDKNKKRNPERVEWTGDSSLWQTKSGIKLGSRLKEIEKWNGKPFKLAGFGWDYEGTVTSWEGGALQAETSQGGRLIVRLREPPNSKATPKERNSVQGDKAFSSSNPVMQILNPHVYQLVLEVGK